jgi:hypothetical protein
MNGDDIPRLDVWRGLFSFYVNSTGKCHYKLFNIFSSMPGSSRNISTLKLNLEKFQDGGLQASQVLEPAELPSICDKSVDTMSHMLMEVDVSQICKNWMIFRALFFLSIEIKLRKLNSQHCRHQLMFGPRTFTENQDKQDNFSTILSHRKYIENNLYFEAEHDRNYHI